MKRLFLTLLLLKTSAAYALDPSRAGTQYVVDHWSLDDGLPNTSLYCMAQTSDGYLWFGTAAGLARFDGARFVVFDRTVAPEFRATVIQSLQAAPDGSLWIGTLDGLWHYRGGRFRHFTTKDGLAGDGVIDMLSTKDGTLLIATDGGVNRLREGKLDTVPMEKGADPSVLSLNLDRAGTPWLSTRSTLYQLRDGKLVKVPVAGDVTMPIGGVYEDGDGQLFVGHRDGLSVLRNGRFVSLVNNGSISGLHPDGDGNVWLVGASMVSRMRDGKLEPRLRNLPTESIMTSLLDREGSLWLGGEIGGLTRVREAKLGRLSSDDGLSGNAVTGLFEDRDGAMWISTLAHGLNRVSGGAVRVLRTPDLPSMTVEFTAQDRDGSFWLGTDNGLAHGDGKRFVPDAAFGSGIAFVTLRDRAGRRWVGATSGLQERLADGRWAVRVAQSTNDLVEDGDCLAVATWKEVGRWCDGKYTVAIPSTGYVNGLQRTADGTLWAGTAAKGLFILRDGRVAQLTADHGLADDVRAIVDDGSGSIWLGSAHGLYRVARDELLAVADGRRARVEPQRFDRADGMKADNTSSGTAGAMRARDGKLWFGTADGVTIVDPKHLRENRLIPPVVIESVVADGRAVAAVAPAGTRKLHFEYTALSFRVPRRVRFRYRLDGYDKEWVEAGTRRAADYTNLPPGRYRFSVKACNDDGVWNEIGAQREFVIEPFFYQTKWFYALSGALLLALAFAAYRLRVGQLLRREVELTRIVDEKTASLKAAQADLVRAERMASVAALVRGIAHELNNPIGFIAGNIDPLRRYSRFLAALAQRLGDGTARSQEELAALLRLSPKKDLQFVVTDLDRMMDDISEGARRAQLIIGDLQGLTAGPGRGLEEVDLARAVRQAIALLSPRLDGIDVAVDVAEAPRVTAEAGQLEQALVNLVDNARLAAPRRLEVRAFVEARQACIRVRDDGCGMTEEVRARASEPFFTTRPAGEGSGLGLAIVASTVSKHRGTLDIESAPGGGTTVTVRIPLGHQR